MHQGAGPGTELASGVGCRARQKRDGKPGSRFSNYLLRYDQGHYFGNKKQAYVSLLERSASSVEISLNSYYYKQAAFEDIEAIMNTIPDVTMEQVSALMKDKRFKAIAYNQFLKSDDAEDLKYRLEDEYHKYTSKEEAQNENETEEQEEIEP